MNFNQSNDKTINEKNGRNLKQLHSVLYRYCMFLANSKYDAEDLAQDTWLKAIGTPNGLDHVNLEAFLLRIAKNTWIDISRRKKVMNRIFGGKPRKVSYVDEETFGIELILQALLKHLSPLQRSVFLLRDVFKFSSSEVSKILDTTEGAIKAALHRARQSLAAIKEELEYGQSSLPEEEGIKTFLRALVQAYQLGDISTLVELSQQNIAYPAVLNRISQERHTLEQFSLERVDSQHNLRMTS